MEPAKTLTIGGSDSGGAAGIQADLKTFSALKTYGMSVVTAVTAQNSLGVDGLYPLPAEFITAQMRAVLSDYGAGAVKTGFVGREGEVKAIAGELQVNHVKNLVVDPVLVNHRGESMFPGSVAQAYRDHLLPLAQLTTPNCQEAALLSGVEVTSFKTMETAAKAIHDSASLRVLITGWHDGQEVVDLLFDGRRTHLFRSPHIQTANTHGSGDTLSAAICAFLAQGLEMLQAVEKARAFTLNAIRDAVDWRLGGGHGPVNNFRF